jgi:hypothetical protein
MCKCSTLFSESNKLSVVLWQYLRKISVFGHRIFQVYAVCSELNYTESCSACKCLYDVVFHVYPTSAC